METSIPAADRCDLALARAVHYRILARSFRHPRAGWPPEWNSLRDGLQQAVELFPGDSKPSPEYLEAVAAVCALDACAIDVATEHARVLGHTPRAAAVPYETEWSGAAGDLLQFHQIADVSAFYAAFGLELGSTCDERADHVSVELEFMQFLCVKEAWAEEQDLVDLAEICRGTERTFLEQHLATWVPGLCARVEAASADGFYARAARLLRLWIGIECQTLGAAPRPVPAAPSATSFKPEDACISCGHVSTCLADLKGATSRADDPVRE